MLQSGNAALADLSLAERKAIGAEALSDELYKISSAMNKAYTVMTHIMDTWEPMKFADHGDSLQRICRITGGLALTSDGMDMELYTWAADAYKVGALLDVVYDNMFEVKKVLDGMRRIESEQ